MSDKAAGTPIDLSGLGTALQAFHDALGRAVAAWLEQNRPALEALAGLAADPRVIAYVEAVERGEVQPPRRRPCLCLCGRAHPGKVNVCDAQAVTTRHYDTRALGPVDVPLCKPCATAQGLALPTGRG